MKAVMGVDPGVKGGISVLAPDGTPALVIALRPDMTHIHLVESVKTAASVLQNLGGYDCFIERVGYIRGDGGKGAFTFGQVNGLLRGAAHAMGLVVHDVSPMLWQAHMGCLSGGNKNVTKNKALELFASRTDVKITHAVADSLLIARYGQWTILRENTK